MNLIFDENVMEPIEKRNAPLEMLSGAFNLTKAGSKFSTTLRTIPNY